MKLNTPHRNQIIQVKAKVQNVISVQLASKARNTTKHDITTSQGKYTQL